MEKKINDVMTLLDDKSYLRTKFFKYFIIDTIDYIKFMYAAGRSSKFPIVGRLSKLLTESYYKNIHTSAVKLPLQNIEDVIMNADHLSVGPCPCRVIFDTGECKAPVFNCIKINHFSEMITEHE